MVSHCITLRTHPHALHQEDIPCGDDFDAKVIVRLINFLLPKTNKHEAVHYMLNEWGTLPPRTPLSKYRELLPDKWKQKNIAQE